ncbi:MAG TPA: DUF2007 domain-containing protein [Opitutaceae bacterium]|nr:DUF2007 domain-containing protein [Opitutaceae bacterium]
MKNIATFATSQEAHNLRAFLESNGIPAFVRDEETAASYSLAIGGVKVDVNDTDFERAAALYSCPPVVDLNALEAEARASLPPEESDSS